MAQADPKTACQPSPRCSLESEEEEDERISLVQQLEEVKEAAGNARLVDSRGEEGILKPNGG